MSPIPGHPLALLIVIVTLALVLALLAPHAGWLHLGRNLVIALLGLCTLLLFGATIGRIIGDFIRDMNANGM